ncbi:MULTISPECIES: hypothetical protein [unclassified Bradyrhizobium]|uniref:hypothetical protein n=1 Tax=unclassified Bradyrhizobium TaxID=2631580 RepID=UPI001FFBF84C|nr:MULTISPECIES: hypothetical protein [unclassified Bradyrhizobium]MCK1311612.1 hypothetical protein [Bradyrhizobium sp. 45]MCK1436850.1 hypothetical protein [Bradyrhizobium sp. 15]MCK1611255.1 hypothetical protein [Bradyrhizobium sp. 163]MCK1761370.1 hypothetical protein [Bradyrhizobium sp. 136]
MVEKLNADGAAKQVTEALQPVVEIKITPTRDPRQAEPVKKPLPADLARALGQAKR